MSGTTLDQSVEKFAALTYAFSDKDLERPWKWGEYEEGVRFAFFRTYEELCELAARREVERAASAYPLTIAQHIMAQYHTAYRDLQAVLLGVTEELAVRVPAEGEWPLRQVLVHIIQADRGFLTNIHYGLEGLRKDGVHPPEMAEEYWNAFWADAPFADLAERGSFAAMQAYHAALHPRILHTFATVTAGELRLPIHFWEGQMPLEFRLHRFSSHLRQHTIQAEKTLEMLGQPLTEAKRLLRMVYNALAGVESTFIGIDEAGEAAGQALAGEITRRAEGIV